jgi:hypothetical protein
MPACALAVLALLPIYGAAASPPRTADLLGIWEEDRGTCEGDNYIAYNSNGTFDGYDFEGRWELHGNTLVTTITKHVVGPDEKIRRVRSLRRVAVTILSSSRTRWVERWSDGSVHHFHRCK